MRSVVRGLGALSYFLGLVAYTLAIAVITLWILTAVGVQSPDIQPVDDYSQPAASPQQGISIVNTTLAIVITFAALLGTLWAIIWVPILVSRSTSKWTHHLAAWLTPGYGSWGLLLIKAGLYLVPVVVLMGVQIMYNSNLSFALLICGVAASAIATIVAALQTLICERLHYKAEAIF